MLAHVSSVDQQTQQQQQYLFDEETLCQSFGRILRLSDSKSVSMVSQKWKEVFDRDCSLIVQNLFTYIPLKKWLDHWNITQVAKEQNKLRSTYFRLRSILGSCLACIPPQSRPKECVEDLMDNPEAVRKVFLAIDELSLSSFDVSTNKITSIPGVDQKPFPRTIPIDLFNNDPIHSKVTELLLNSPEFDTIPAQLALLKSLELIWINCKTIASVSKDLDTMPKLSTLILQCEEPVKISSKIWHIDPIKRLTIETTESVTIPTSILKAQNLEEFCIQAKSVQFEEDSVRTFLSTLRKCSISETGGKHFDPRVKKPRGGHRTNQHRRSKLRSKITIIKTINV